MQYLVHWKLIVQVKLLNSECLEKANHGTIAKFFNKSFFTFMARWSET